MLVADSEQGRGECRSGERMNEGKGRGAGVGGASFLSSSYFFLTIVSD